ncbi:MAG: SOS response-associated peptidase [Chloroflexi bacterium]|nr:SOS response-associated peptidase [Chloroflexota bacterium]
MCGRFSLAVPKETLVEQFEVATTPDLGPRYNIAPTQPVAVVRLAKESGARFLSEVRWGLIPAWAKDPAIGQKMINARAETAAEKPAFRGAFKYRRCLVVADGFYEWQKTGSSKQPFRIHMRDGQPFAFAGLWETWKGSDGIPVETCTILTTEPNSLMQQIHNRMPVILEKADYPLWLDPEVQDVALLGTLMRSYAADQMESYPVGSWVNNPRNDDPRCLAPLAV